MHEHKGPYFQKFEEQDLRGKDRVGHGQEAVGDPAQGGGVCHMQGQHAVHHRVFGEFQPRGIHFGPVQPVEGDIAPVEELAPQEDAQGIQSTQPAPSQPGEVFLFCFAVKDGIQQPM